MSIRDLIVYGAGGFGREIAAMSTDGCNAGHGTPRWRVTGFVDDTPGFRGQLIHGEIPCMGSLAEVVEAREDQETWCFIALGDNDKRREAAKRIEKAGWHAAVFVHTEAYLARDAQLGEGCVIGPLSTISPNVSIGRYALVATRTSIGHHAAIGDFAQIAVGASVLGYANIGTGAMIGTNAAVLPGIKVGAWATVAACTPAMTHVKAGTTICLPLARTIFKRDRLPDDDTESGV